MKILKLPLAGVPEEKRAQTVAACYDVKVPHH